jgi:hypothetical protein
MAAGAGEAGRLQVSARPDLRRRIDPGGPELPSGEGKRSVWKGGAR